MPLAGIAQCVNNSAVKWSKCTEFTKDIEWLGFKLSNKVQ